MILPKRKSHSCEHREIIIFVTSAIIFSINALWMSDIFIFFFLKNGRETNPDHYYSTYMTPQLAPWNILYFQFVSAFVQSILLDATWTKIITDARSQRDKDNCNNENWMNLPFSWQREYPVSTQVLRHKLGIHRMLPPPLLHFYHDAHIFTQ